MTGSGAGSRTAPRTAAGRRAPAPRGGASRSVGTDAAARAPDLLALDAAILLSAPCRRRLAELNRTLRPPPDGFRFDATHLPHVTLVQQFVEAGRVDEAVRRAAAAARGAAPFRLRSTGVSRGRTASTLRLAAVEPLVRLHLRLLDALEDLDAGPGGAAAFLSDGGEPPRAADVAWVARFRADAAGSRFDPHVTLGVGAAVEPAAPIRTAAARVALCHLGRFCTCRRVLAEWRLPSDA